MDFKNELKKYKDIVDQEIDRVLPKMTTPQARIFEAMRYSALAGGKRLRPILLLKACELVGGHYKEALPYAVAIEFIHTYSLIHDDLPAMDDDTYRRGKETNHIVFGEDIAILAGDGLLNLAYEIMIEAALNHQDEERRGIKALREVAKAAGVFGMVGGQVVDVLSENQAISEDTLEYIHQNKTSALIEASILAGAIIGGGDPSKLGYLKAYGEAIGLGFQIRDDILDKYGDMTKLGKDIGSDEEKNKATYLSLYGLDASIKKTQDLYTEALKALECFGDNSNRVFFEDLGKYLVNRDS